MNGQEAKDRVWAHWNYLQTLCARKFPADANLAEEASHHVLDELEANDWQRVKAWGAQGDFKTFLTVVVNRLLIDFRRKRLGYQRPPKWLQEKIDEEKKALEPQHTANTPDTSSVSFWERAYKLLYHSNYSRQEAIEKLLTQETHLERKRVVEIVTMILARCPAPIMSTDAPKQSLDEINDVESEQPDPLMECLGEEERRWETWAGLLLEHGGNPTTSQLSHEQLQRFRQSIHLTEEDRMLLRLRYAEGLAVPTIAKMLGLKGDSYRRLGRLLAELEQAFRQLKLYEARE